MRLLGNPGWPRVLGGVAPRGVPWGWPTGGAILARVMAIFLGIIWVCFVTCVFSEDAGDQGGGSVMALPAGET